MDDVIVYNVAPILSNADLVELVRSTKRLQPLLSPLCRQRLYDIYQQYTSISGINPYIYDINHMSIDKYNRQWNTNYRNYSDLFVIHYRYFVDAGDKSVVEPIIYGRYYDIITQRVSMLDHILTAESLITDDPILTRYVNMGIKYVYDNVYNIGYHDVFYFANIGYWSKEYTKLYLEAHRSCLALVEFLYNVDRIYPVLHKLWTINYILTKDKLRVTNCVYMHFTRYFYYSILSLSNISRYLHYIDYFGITNKSWLLSNIDDTINKYDKIESVEAIRKFMDKLLSVIGNKQIAFGVRYFFDNNNREFVRIATESILDHYHDSRDIIKNLLRSYNYEVYRVLFERYGDDIIRYTIDNFTDVNKVNVYNLTNALLKERDSNIYIHMLIRRLRVIGAKNQVRCVKSMYNRYI